MGKRQPFELKSYVSIRDRRDLPVKGFGQRVRKGYIRSYDSNLFCKNLWDTGSVLHFFGEIDNALELTESEYPSLDIRIAYSKRHV